MEIKKIYMALDCDTEEPVFITESQTEINKYCAEHIGCYQTVWEVNRK